MDKDQLIKRLMKTFLEELEEHVGALNRDLLALEKDSSGQERTERLKALFRTAHSLKGAARSVNVDADRERLPPPGGDPGGGAGRQGARSAPTCSRCCSRRPTPSKRPGCACASSRT